MTRNGIRLPAIDLGRWAVLGRKGWTETWTNFESQYLGLGYEDGLGLGMGAALLCAPSQNGPWKHCDGTNYASLSYSQGRACPSPFCTYPPVCASGSAITSRWFKGKKNTCQESAKNVRLASHCCGHRVDIPQGQFDLSSPAASTSQRPPGLARLPLHCLHWCSWCWEISQHSPE